MKDVKFSTIDGELRVGKHLMKNVDVRVYGEDSAIRMNDEDIPYVMRAKKFGRLHLLEHFSPEARLTTFFLGSRIKSPELEDFGYQKDELKAHYIYWIGNIKVLDTEGGELFRELIVHEIRHNDEVDRKVFGEMKDKIAKYQQADMRRRQLLILKTIINPPSILFG